MSDMQQTIKDAENQAPQVEPGSTAATMAELEFTTDLGAKVTLHIPVGHIQHYQRYLGRLGWTSVQIPPGGLQLPFAIEEDFDWALIGARKVKFEDDIKVFYKGEWYTRRVMDEVKPTKKLPKGLPPAVKYSRGAKPYDDSSMIEKTEGDIEMVPLAVFRGGGEQFKLHLVLPEAREKYRR